MRCHPEGTEVWYTLFSNQTALDNYLNEPPPDGFQPCPGGGQGPQDWHRAASPQQPEGKVECYSETVMWSMNSQLLAGYVHGANIDQLYQWWQAHYQ